MWGEEKPLSFLYLFLLLDAHFHLSTASQESYVPIAMTRGEDVLLPSCLLSPSYAYESATDCKPQAAQDCSTANIASLPPFMFSYIWRKQTFGSICDRTALVILIYTSRHNARAWKKDVP